MTGPVPALAIPLSEMMAGEIDAYRRLAVTVPQLAAIEKMAVELAAGVLENKPGRLHNMKRLSRQINAAHQQLMKEVGRE